MAYKLRVIRGRVVDNREQLLIGNKKGQIVYLPFIFSHL